MTMTMDFRFDSNDRPLISNDLELLAAIRGGIRDARIDPALLAAVSDAQTARAGLETAAATLAAREHAWAEERAALLTGALALALPEQTQAIQLAERGRIKSILAMQRRGFEKITGDAIDQGLNVERYALAVLAAQQDRGITLDQIEADSPRPAMHAVPSDGSARAGKSWDEILKAKTSGRM